MPGYEDPQTGWIWVAKISDVYVYKSNALEYHSSIEEFGITDFYRDIHGNMWLVNEKNDALVWHEQLRSWEIHIQGRFHTRRNQYFQTWNENLWFVTGEYIFEDEKQILYTPDQVYTFLFDMEGSLWLGTHTSGLVLLKKNYFKTYSDNNGMPWKNVYAIIEDYDNNIWAGNYRSGVGVINQNGTVDTVGIEETAWGGFITSLFMGKMRGLPAISSGLFI